MQDDKGFVIRDRRFSMDEEDAGKKPGDGSQTEENKGSKPTEAGPAEEAGPEGDISGEDVLPEVNFATFVVSLSSSILVHLGEIEDPQTGQKEENLPLARHTIDILALLQEKTKGNLNVQEEQLLNNILYDLRMRYVRKKS
ncbi:MAG: DUF1844 domain-containing protein [Thermodesulfobacteriota bacterium]